MVASCQKIVRRESWMDDKVRSSIATTRQNRVMIVTVSVLTRLGIGISKYWLIVLIERSAT